MNIRIQCILIVLTFLFLGFLPQMQAVSPPPDGGYPGGNTAEGQTALLSLTSGGYNTAVGYLSLRSDTTNGFNTAIGAGALLTNTADENTATGVGALLSNTTGFGNTASGAFALFSNTTGSDNTASGLDALLNNTTGNGNTANGVAALDNNTIGNDNTANGGAALHNTTGDGNTASGNQALYNNTTGSHNTAVGDFAGSNVITANHVICIDAAGADVSNSCYIGQIFGATSSLGTAVFINSAGQLGTTTSSRRFKEGIKPMERASEALFALKPVSFRYKKEIDPAGTPQLGLVAEDVEKVNPHLVVRDKEGKPYSVRYDQVNAMLLNEFLREHSAFVEEHRQVEQQQKEIDALKAELREQRSLIQKVNDKVELKTSASQVVVNKQ